MAVKNEVDGANRMRKQELIFALLKNQAKKGECDLRRRHAGSAARRLRIPALSGHVVPGRHRRHLRLALADPPLQPAHRRHDRRRDPHAQGRRALFRAGQGRQGQRRVAGELASTRSSSRTSRRITRPSTSSSSATSRPKRTSPAASSTSSRRSARASAGSIVSPPKAGKTVLMQHIAHAITANHPEVDADRAAHRRAARGSDRDASAR